MSRCRLGYSKVQGLQYPQSSARRVAPSYNAAALARRAGIENPPDTPVGCPRCAKYILNVLSPRMVSDEI